VNPGVLNGLALPVHPLQQALARLTESMLGKLAGQYGCFKVQQQTV
jgi:hypothetical protein